MKRTSLSLVFAAALVIAGWSAGKAQTRVADFEISIDAPRGDIHLTCSRGCEWDDGGSALQKLSFQCDKERCRASFNGHGQITLGMPR